MAAIWIGVGSDSGTSAVRETFRLSTGVADDDYDVQRQRFDLSLAGWPWWLTSRWQPRLDSTSAPEHFTHGVDLLGLANLTRHGSVHWQGPTSPVENREGK